MKQERLVALQDQVAAAAQGGGDADAAAEPTTPTPLARMLDGGLDDDAADDDDDEHDPTRRLPGFGEPWAEQKERIRRSSPIGNEPGWGLLSCIVKSNDDLRQEVCALQIIAACDDAFRAAGLSGDRTGLWLRHYSIVPTGASTGIIETMSDAISLDSLKKSKGYRDLRTHLAAAHGGDGSARLARARRAFISSHAAFARGAAIRFAFSRAV